MKQEKTLRINNVSENKKRLTKSKQNTLTQYIRPLTKNLNRTESINPNSKSGQTCNQRNNTSTLMCNTKHQDEKTLEGSCGSKTNKLLANRKTNTNSKNTDSSNKTGKLFEKKYVQKIRATKKSKKIDQNVNDRSEPKKVKIT